MSDSGVIPEISMGIRLELARRRTGMTQAQLGEQMGLGRRTIHDFETDVRPPKRGTLLGWAQLTGVSVTWLETGRAATPEGDGTVVDLRARRDSNSQPSDLVYPQVSAA